MKKPEEIKKGLESHHRVGGCIPCPYDVLGDGDCSGTLAGDALSLIQQLEAQVPRWIPVEERMPEDFVSVIGYLPINSREGFPPTREVYHTERGWYVPVLGGLCIVTHWMPLPEAPKEDAHEQSD